MPAKGSARVVGCVAASVVSPSGRCRARSCRRCRCGRDCGPRGTAQAACRGLSQTFVGHATRCTPICLGLPSSRNEGLGGRSSGPSCCATGDNAGDRSGREWPAARWLPPRVRGEDNHTTEPGRSSGCSPWRWSPGRSRIGNGQPRRTRHSACACALLGGPSGARNACRVRLRTGEADGPGYGMPRTSCPCVSCSRRTASGASGSEAGWSLLCRSRIGISLPDERALPLPPGGLLLAQRGGRSAGRVRRKSGLASCPNSTNPFEK